MLLLRIWNQEPHLEGIVINIKWLCRNTYCTEVYSGSVFTVCSHHSENHSEKFYLLVYMGCRSH